MIRPIDMQMILPRTETVGTERQVEQQKIVNANTDAATEVAKEVQHNSETVVQKDANAFTEYKYDAKEEGNGTYRNPKKKKKNQEEDNDDTKEAKDESIVKKKDPPRVNFQI